MRVVLDHLLQHRRKLSSVFLCLVLSPVLANEQPVSGVHPFLTSKYSIVTGLYSPHKELKFRFDGSLGGSSTAIDFDKQFRLDKGEDVFALEFMWRFAVKWSLRMQHFKSSRQQSAILAEDIQWGDNVIQAGSSVTAGTEFEMTRIFFARAFDSHPQYEYGIGLGIHWLTTGAFIERDLITNFAEISAVSASGPLPNIGAWYYYSPSEKWYFGGRLDWFEASVKDYSGSIINLAVGANYQLFEHFGVGANYQFFKFAAGVDTENWRGRAETVFEGLYLFVSVNW